MTTKEEKARLVAIAGILRETAEELTLICGVEITNLKELRDFTAAQAKKEKPEPKEPDVKEPMRIGDLNIGDEGIVIEGEILDISRIAGTTKAGNAYEKVSMSINDGSGVGSGVIKLILWNEQVAEIENLQVNDIIRVEAWKVEKGYKSGGHELVYGKFGSIKKVNIERHII